MACIHNVSGETVQVSVRVPSLHSDPSKWRAVLGVLGYGRGDVLSVDLAPYAVLWALDETAARPSLA
jgi:hypothetical protein